MIVNQGPPVFCCWIAEGIQVFTEERKRTNTSEREGYLFQIFSSLLQWCYSHCASIASLKSTYNSVSHFSFGDQEESCFFHRCKYSNCGASSSQEVDAWIKGRLWIIKSEGEKYEHLRTPRAKGHHRKDKIQIWLLFLAADFNCSVWVAGVETYSFDGQFWSFSMASSIPGKWMLQSIMSLT